jgi:hypothetical protein
MSSIIPMSCEVFTKDFQEQHKGLLNQNFVYALIHGRKLGQLICPLLLIEICGRTAEACDLLKSLERVSFIERTVHDA